jgi:anti-sigma regulatory factor (Ser/Thr protein kinase)
MPPHLVVRAMRDSGYRNAAYAIAELADNAIQAGANMVEILCEEKDEKVRKRVRKRVQSIAVADNGCGMDADTLRMALQYGNGTRLEDRTGIGRFGMGLPNSSLSQAQRVDVYTWQDGVSSAIHSYLDVDRIRRGELREVPEPARAHVPPQWLEQSHTAAESRSGTIVIWTRLDRCDWKTAHAIFRNSEFTIGRIYRRMLDDDSARIRMAAFMEGASECHYDQNASPNDPLYLMENTSCPSPWDSEAMFEPYGEPFSFDWTDGLGERHTVTIRCSIAKSEARSADNAGRLRHGGHAKNNIGVSVMRAERELELQGEWCVGYDPRERWWGVEVEFPPSLDEVFGVTNNKQSANALADFAKVELDQIASREGYESEQALREAWRDDGDPRHILIEVKNHIESNLGAIRRTLKAQGEGRRTVQRHNDPTSAEVIGTKATLRRRADGYEGQSDLEESAPSDERERAIREDLVASGLDESEATDRASSLISDGRKYEFYKVDLSTPEFFSVRKKGGALLIGLNTNHPAYDRLVTVLEHHEDDHTLEALQARLQRSYDGLKLLLEAWARYEDECADGPRRERAQEARLDWGRIAREFFRTD